MNKLILCRWVARKGAPPRLVALLPQAETIDEIGTQTKPPGFNMINLPFADDIRHLRFNEDGEGEGEGENVNSASAIIASHEQIDKAKALINKLALPGRYDPDAYDNPVLQRHYANLQALALDQEPEGDSQDCTMPAYDRIKMRAETEINEFKEAIGLKDVLEDVDQTTTTVKAKRSAPKSDDYDCISAIATAKNDPKALSKFTVSDLKLYLDSIGIRAKRLKSEIIEQIQTQ